MKFQIITLSNAQKILPYDLAGFILFLKSFDKFAHPNSFFTRYFGWFKLICFPYEQYTTFNLNKHTFRKTLLALVLDTQAPNKY